MLKSMRRKNFTRDLVIFVVVALLASYVLVGFGSAPPTVQGDTIARIGKAKIKVRDALIIKEDLMNQYRQVDREQLEQATTNRVVSEAVFQDGAVRNGVVVSLDELKDNVILRRKIIGGDKYLDGKQWQDFISYQYRLQVESYETYLRDKELRSQKFRELFYDAAYVSDTEVEDEFMRRNRLLDLEFANIYASMLRSDINTSEEELRGFYDANPDRFMSGPQRQILVATFRSEAYQDQVEISDEQVNEYYEANKESRYAIKERIRLSHILLTPGEGEGEDALEKRAESIKAEIEDGLAFADAVNRYSQDESTKTSEGSLGWQVRGTLARRFGPEFEKQAFDAEVGKLQGPLASSLGLHLIKVEEHTPEGTRPLEEVKDTIANTLSANEAKEKARSAAGDFLAQVREGKGFSQAAEQAGIPLETSDFFDDDRRAVVSDTLGSSLFLVPKAFALEKLQDVSDLIEANRDFYVIQWIDEKEPELLDFEKNMKRIQYIAETDQVVEKVESACKEIKTRLEENPDLTLAEIAPEYGRMFVVNQIKQTGLFGEDRMPQEIQARYPVKFDDLYALNENEMLGPIPDQQGVMYFFARVTAKVSPDEEQLTSQKEQIRESLRARKGATAMIFYLEGRQAELDPQSQVMARVQATVSRI